MVAKIHGTYTKHVAIGRHVRRAELQREKECQIAFSYIVLMHAYM